MIRYLDSIWLAIACIIASFLLYKMNFPSIWGIGGIVLIVLLDLLIELNEK